jgi:hypothetical protein
MRLGAGPGHVHTSAHGLGESRSPRLQRQLQCWGGFSELDMHAPSLSEGGTDMSSLVSAGSESDDESGSESGSGSESEDESDSESESESDSESDSDEDDSDEDDSEDESLDSDEEKEQRIEAARVSAACLLLVPMCSDEKGLCRVIVCPSMSKECMLPICSSNASYRGPVPCQRGTQMTYNARALTCNALKSTWSMCAGKASCPCCSSPRQRLQGDPALTHLLYPGSRRCRQDKGGDLWH